MVLNLWILWESPVPILFDCPHLGLRQFLKLVVLFLYLLLYRLHRQCIVCRMEEVKLPCQRTWNSSQGNTFVRLPVLAVLQRKFEWLIHKYYPVQSKNVEFIREVVDHLHFILRCSLVARLSLFDNNTLSAYLPCYCV